MDWTDRTSVWYECRVCGSLLLWVGSDRWTYQKVGREDKIHLLKQCLTVAELQALVEAGATNPAPTSRPVEESEPQWGLRMNTGWRQGAKDYPQWARPVDGEKWHKSGVIVWDRNTQVITHLSAIQAVRILDSLQNDKAWEQSGVTIGEPATRLFVGHPEREPQDVLLNRIALDPLQAQQLFDLLLRNEAELKKMADGEKKAQDKVLYGVYNALIQSVHEHELKEFKWAERPMTWIKDEAQNLWTCDSPPNRAIIILKKDHWLWDVCIKKRASTKNGYKQFAWLQDAVAWAEEQLAAAVMEAEVGQGVQPTPTAMERRSTIDLGPYRIDPSTLEPERITYQVVLELNSAPEHYKTMELLCGGELRYDERYPSPRQLAAELQIDQAEYELEQPVGPNDSWNVGRSTVTYYRESVAVEQAQLMWNKSRIVEHYGKRKLLSARYGVKEVETGYVSWIGGCENIEKPWAKELARAEYLVRKAEGLTLANALDVDGFREFTGWSQEVMTDDLILSALHHRRMNSPAIPAASRAESRRWLREQRDSRE